MKKIFLAGPFKALVNKDTQIMSDEHIGPFSAIINHFEDKGWSVHCAHKREKWGREFMTPAECTTIDYEEISKCDYFVAFPGVPASPGTHIELGWASAMKKRIILLLEEGQEYAYLVQGLDEITSIKKIYYTSKGVEPTLIERQINEFESSYDVETV